MAGIITVDNGNGCEVWERNLIIAYCSLRFWHGTTFEC